MFGLLLACTGPDPSSEDSASQPTDEFEETDVRLSRGDTCISCWEVLLDGWRTQVVFDASNKGEEGQFRWEALVHAITETPGQYYDEAVLDEGPVTIAAEADLHIEDIGESPYRAQTVTVNLYTLMTSGTAAEVLSD